jgi:hypothetical protein
MLKFFKVAVTGAALATLLMAAQCSNSSTPTGGITVDQVLADIQAACQFQPTAATVMQVAEAVAAATGNPALVAGTTIGTAIATAVEQAICGQKAALMAANASLKSLAKGAKESLNIVIKEVTVDGKPVTLPNPVAVNGVVTG